MNTEKIADSAPYLSVEALNKSFGAFKAIDNVSFAARCREFVTILGPSGCGKTTLLRCIAGLEPQSNGVVRIEGKDVSGLPVSKRNVGIVFQNYALFPNLSARENVAYGLTNRRTDRRKILRRVEELLDLVDLMGLGEKYPAQLSGGQQQRVALARAMALSPDLLLLDEPLSALDAKVRVMLRGEIRQLQQRLGVTTIMVTHDQEEALTMADRILVMNKGQVAQYGTPLDIYDAPATPFVASFIGSMNFLENAVVEDDRLRVGEARLITGNGRTLTPGGKATLAIRPEDVQVLADNGAGLNRVRGKVRHLEYRGATYRLRCSLHLGRQDEDFFEVEAAPEKVRRLRLEADRMVSLGLPPDRIHVYPM